jgi:riboflavin-specific deaminase-like protein
MVHSQFWWKKILMLKSYLQQMDNADISMLAIYPTGYIKQDDFDCTEPGTLIILFDPDQIDCIAHKEIDVVFAGPAFQLKVIKKSAGLDIETAEFLCLYLPYALTPFFSKQLQKIYSVAHLTQSVDGRIATVTGHSKWIGNEEDLLHVHCMRSLCDAVIIGGNTLRLDEPKLTVRNVEGPNPIKIIIGNKQNNLQSLLDHNTVPIISFSNQPLYPDNTCVQEFIFEGNQIHTQNILNTLYQQGIQSVYVEGGASTVSCFLKEKTIDSLQVHIANKILGSGKPSICLDEINLIDECLTLRNTRHYLLGDEILMVSNI